MKDFLKGIFTLAIFVFVVWIIINGGGPLLILFGLFVGALLLKCWR